MRRLAFACCLALLVAGCNAPVAEPTPGGPGPGSGTPTAQPTNLSITVENPTRGPYAVSVAVVPGAVEGLTVSYADGTTRTYEPATLATLSPNALDNVTDVRPTNAAASTRVNATGRERVTSRLPGVTRNATVFHATIDREDNSLVIGGTLECAGAQQAGVSVEIVTENEVIVGTNCRAAR